MEDSQPLLPRAVTCPFYSRRGFPSGWACSAGPRARVCPLGELLGAGPLGRGACTYSAFRDAATASPGHARFRFSPRPAATPPPSTRQGLASHLEGPVRHGEGPLLFPWAFYQQISNASNVACIFGECVYCYANCLLQRFAYFPIRFSVVLIGLLVFFTSSRCKVGVSVS